MIRVIVLFLSCASAHAVAQAWSGVGTFVGVPWSIGSFNNELYVGAIDTTPDFPPTKLLHKYASSAWSVVQGADSYNAVHGDVIRCMQEYNGEFYIGGYFATLSGISQNHALIKNNGTSWSKLGSGFASGSLVVDMTVWNNKLIAVGDFTTAGGVAVNNIAAWDGNSWTGLGSGIDPDAYCVHAFNGDLYVAGLMASAGGQPVNGIAKWNGSSWSGAGLSKNSTAMPTCMAEYKNELYAGGFFILDSISPVISRVIKWNGSKWENVGTGIGISQVYAMTLHNNELFVAGSGTVTSATPLNSIGKWNGTSWSNLGNGITGIENNTFVMGLLSRPEGLYACGSFTGAGGLTVSGVALWSTPAGLSEAENSSRLSLFPNPASSHFSIRNGGASSLQLEIFDLSGRMVIKTNYENVSLSVSDLANGIYLVIVNNGRTTTIRRLVVNHSDRVFD